MAKRICLGKIAAAHGVKGLVKVLPYGDDPTLIETLGAAFVSESSDKTVSVFLKSSAGKFILAEIEGCKDKDAADALRGTELWYERSVMPEPDEGQYYYEDLVGLRVVENDEEIGAVVAVDNFGASDLLEIKPKKGAAYYLPFVDEYVVGVDLDAGIVTVQNSAAMRMD